MSTADCDQDINDVFDNILLSEEKIVQRAFQEGFDAGKKNGELDGYHAGYHRGAELGAEIGFYKGIVESFSGNEVHGVNEKVLQILQKLNSLLESFPKYNNHDCDIQSMLDNIRSQYKKLCSIMKLNLPYPTSSRMSF